MSEYRYYRAEGRSLEIIQGWRQEILEYRERVEALSKEMGVEEWLYRGHSVHGFRLAPPIPPGWIQVQGFMGFYRPHGNRKVSRRARDILSGAPDRWDLNKALTGSSFLIRGLHTYMVGFEDLGGTIVLKVPDVEGAGDPPGAVSLTTAEYYRLKADAAEAA